MLTSNNLMNSTNSLFHGMAEEQRRQVFSLIIPYPLASNNEFARIDDILQMAGVSLSYIVADYISLPAWQRFDNNNVYNAIGNTIFNEINSVFESIDSHYDESRMTYVADDPDDQYLITLSMTILSAPSSDPMSPYAITMTLVPILQYLYANLIIPEDFNLFDEWDHDLAMINQDTAVIMFLEKENVSFLQQQIA